MSTLPDGSLPPIPPEMGRLSGEVEFRRHGGGWLLLGPAHLLPVGGRVTVRRWGREEAAGVVVTGYAAERIVHHREGSYTRESTGRESTRFVIATFERKG